MYFPKPSLNENDMAIIERGDTAAHSIEAGQYVSWHGKTGKAKAAILQGATLSDTLFDYDEDGVLNASMKMEVKLLGEFTGPSQTKTLAENANNFKFLLFEQCFIDTNGNVNVFTASNIVAVDSLKDSINGLSYVFTALHADADRIGRGYILKDGTQFVTDSGGGFWQNTSRVRIYGIR